MIFFAEQQSPWQLFHTVLKGPLNIVLHWYFVVQRVGNWHSPFLMRERRKCCLCKMARGLVHLLIGQFSKCFHIFQQNKVCLYRVVCTEFCTSSELTQTQHTKNWQESTSIVFAAFFFWFRIFLKENSAFTALFVCSKWMYSNSALEGHFLVHQSKG